MPRQLTISLLQSEAAKFAKAQSSKPNAELYGMDNGKTIGTHIEREFQKHLLLEDFVFEPGNAAEGIDFPGLDVDIKVTSIRKPQSSCPFKDARQKIYGLGYSLLIFVYEKEEDDHAKTTQLRILHCVFVSKERTGDFQTTSGLRKVIENDANRADILAFIGERRLPVDEIGAEALADEILRNPPEVGYLTMSDALQWRLSYDRVVKLAGNVEGVARLTLP